MSLTARVTALPLSLLQERLWVLDQVAPDPCAFRKAEAYRLTGELDVEALGAAFDDVVRRHDALRTVFELDEGGLPHARVLADPAGGLAGTDLTRFPAEQREGAATSELAEEVRCRFDLRTGPLLRLRLVRVDRDVHLLALTIHDACADARSLAVIWNELARAYAARRAGEPPTWPAPDEQYGAYALRQRERLAAGELERAIAFWRDRLRGLQPLELPADRPRPPTQSYRSDVVVSALPADVVDGVRALCARTGTTIFDALLAALEVVLARYSGQEDFAVGTASERTPARAVGPFANTLVLRGDVSGDPAFVELLERTRLVVRAAKRHRAAPFEKIVEALQPAPDVSRHPLFQVALQVVSSGFPVFDRLTVAPVELDVGVQPLDLSLEAVETPSALLLRARYATDLYDGPRIARLLGHLGEVLRAAAGSPDLRVSELPLLTAAERRLLLDDWQGERVEQPRTPVHAQVAARAAVHPEVVAARLGEDELTYGELVHRAEALSRRLRELGVGREDVVAVALEPGLDLLVALVGVLRAGGAFVVMDASHPQRRLEFILADTAAKAVVTSAALVPRLPAPGRWMPICVDRDWPAIEALAAGAGPLEELADEDALAYVLYTSGSTGQPKGVLIEHHALTTFLLWLRGLFDLGPGDRILQQMALIFDFAIGEIFTALTAGATLVFVPEAERRSLVTIGQLLERERITYLGGTPAILGALPRGDYPDLRAMVAGGEAFSADLVNRWNVRSRRFVNGYGPTEAAIGCIFYECEHRTWTTSPPIGRPMPRRFAYVVDRHGGLCPVGVPGEIVVGGAGLARGYLNSPELTAQRFCDDPFRPEGEIYRTGDLGVWTEEGQIQFLGRIDSQIKLNGLRIELEEIESALARDPQVAAAAVIVYESAPDAKQLVAYLVPADGEIDAAAVRARLADELPPYMIPHQFLTLATLPLTPVGKIDRPALPTPRRGRETIEYIPPRTPAEELVAATFADVLGVERVGTEADFFALGGTSLDAARAVQRLREAGAAVPLRLLYGNPAVGRLAAAIEALPSGA